MFVCLFKFHSSVGRTLEEFKTSVTVAPHKKVTFELTYEELLKRTLGKYELQIHARPMQPVKDFKVCVSPFGAVRSIISNHCVGPTSLSQISGGCVHARKCRNQFHLR